MRSWASASAMAAGAFGLLALLPRAALAGCAEEIAALKPKVEQVAPGRQRELLDFDLKRARKELNEADEKRARNASAGTDERECQEALDHAGTLLHAGQD